MIESKPFKLNNKRIKIVLLINLPKDYNSIELK